MRLRDLSAGVARVRPTPSPTGQAGSVGAPSSSPAVPNGAASQTAGPAPQARRPRVRGRVRTQWMALGAALVVLAGVVVAWAVAAAGRRVMVVQVAQQVAAGDVLDADDLLLTGVAFDPGVEGLVPAASLDALIGRVAAIDLEPGVLLQRGMWRDGAVLRDGERAVGAVLDAGRFPLGLGVGSTVLAASLTDLSIAGPSAEGAPPPDPDSPTGPVSTLPVSMRVVDVVALDDGSVSFSFAVPLESAVLVAQLAATDQLVVVGTLAADVVSPTTTDPAVAP